MASMNVFGILEGCSDGLFLRSYSLRFDGPRKVMKGVPIVVGAACNRLRVGSWFLSENAAVGVGWDDAAIVNCCKYIVRPRL